MNAHTPLDARPGSSTPWLVRSRAAGDEPLRLFCLPYAGGGASTFRSWPARLPGIDVVSVQSPGRETRLSEPPLKQMAELVAALADAVEPELDRPYAIFGHSLGARVAFELARELRRRGRPSPSVLFASACKAPHLPRPPLPKFESMPEKVFVARLKRMNGTPPEVFDNPELLELVLPAIRADFALADDYEYDDEAALQCPIRVYGGTFDPEAREDELLAWQAHTTSSFELTMLAGGHFVIASHEAEITTGIAATLVALALVGD